MASPSEFDDEDFNDFEIDEHNSYFEIEETQQDPLIPNPNINNLDSILLETNNNNTIQTPQNNSPPDEPRPLFQRLWTEDDEIVILEGFLDFVTKRGTSHHSYQHDTGPFYDIIKDKISLEFSKNQLIEKLRRLKRTFRSVDGRISAMGDRFRFKSDHERRRYEISKMIWGSTVKKTRNGRKIEERSDFNGKDEGSNVVEETVKSCLKPMFTELIKAGFGNGGSLLNSLSLGLGLGSGLDNWPNGQKWKEQQILELEVYLKRVELLEEHIRSSLEELKAKLAVEGMQTDE